MSITIVGLTDDNRLPGFFGETDYNAGLQSAGSIPLLLLLSGTMLVGTGSATPNQDVDFITSADDADGFYGPGSELAVQCYAALQIPGVSISAAPVPEAGGAAAATATITVSGSWTVGGTYTFRVDGIAVQVTAQSTDTVQTFAASIAAAVAATPHLSVTAAVGAGPAYTVTLTRKSKGARGNQGVLFQDVSAIPSGMTVTIAAGLVTTVAAGSNTQTLPQSVVNVASVGALAASGQVSLPALPAVLAYTGVQTAAATTVASGSNAVALSTFTGSGVLDVASTAGWPTSGTIYLPTFDAVLTYTGTAGGNSFTGVTTVSGSGSLATGNAVDGTLLTGVTTVSGSGALATGQSIYQLNPMTGGGTFFTGGTGVDSVATLLSSVIVGTQYDRIAPAQNDATNAEAWHTFVNNQAAPLVGLLEHLVFATNGTFSAATSLAQTDLNAERGQLLWQVNGETIPSAVAAVFAANRTSTEQGDPDAAYDGYPLPGVAPQTQKSDWPNTNTLIAALNDGVTPVTTNVGGQAYVVRSITTHSQDAFGNPQYTTLDTSDAVVPDFVRTTLRLYWTQVIKPANKRNGPDPGPTQRTAPAGVITPSAWTRFATAQLNILEAAPNLFITDVADNPVYSEWDAAAKRIMSVVPVVPAYNTHAIGVSVRGVETG